MDPTTNSQAPADFISLTALLAPGGLVASRLSPPPSRRSLNRGLRRLRVPRWKVNVGAARGGGEVYYSRRGVEVWLSLNVWTGLDE
jgi:hypothetical protein